mgnify:CR=1 FL=1
MTKSSKKRNKKYTGRDATRVNGLVHIHKSTAVVRSDFGQWLHEHRKTIRNIAIGLGVILLVVAGILSIH